MKYEFIMRAPFNHNNQYSKPTQYDNKYEINKINKTFFLFNSSSFNWC